MLRGITFREKENDSYEKTFVDAENNDVHQKG